MYLYDKTVMTDTASHVPLSEQFEAIQNAATWML